MAASTFGVVNVYLGTTSYTTNTATMNVNDTLTVKVWNQAPTSGVMGLAGSITATPSGKLQALGQFAWTTQPTYPGTYGETLFVLSNFGFAGSAPYPNYTYSDPLDPTSITGWLGNYLYSVVKPLGQPAQTSPGALTTTWNLGGTPGSTDGSMANIGSGQCSMDFIGGNNPAVVTGKTSPVLVGSYQVKATAAGTVTLHFADSGGVANAGSYGGWYTAGRDVGDDGVGTTTDLVITINGGTQLSLVNSGTPLDGVSLPRLGHNIIQLKFNGNITALPAAGKIQVIQALTGGTTGTDVSSNWTYSIVNDGSGNPTILQLDEPGAYGVVPPATTMVNKQWYAVRNNGWTAADNFVIAFPLQKGDINADNKANSNDLAAAVSAGTALHPPFTSRYDINGDLKINSNDLAAVLGVGTALAPARPTGWVFVP